MSDETAQVLIVGSRGFLGSELKRQFISAGVAVIEATSDAPVDHLPDSTIAATQSIFWAASGVTPAGAAENPKLADTELQYFCRSVDRFQELTPNARILLASSGGTVYDDTVQPPYIESNPTRSSGKYGQMKLAMEVIVSEAGGTSLRFSNLYGPGQTPRRGLGVIAHWISAIAENRPVRIFGDPQNSRDYLAVSDAARAGVGAALHQADVPSALNVGCGYPTSLLELLAVLRSVVGDREMTVEQLEDPRPFDRSSTWLNIEKIEKCLGWVPQISLTAGVAETWTARVPPT